MYVLCEISLCLEAVAFIMQNVAVISDCDMA